MSKRIGLASVLFAVAALISGATPVAAQQGIVPGAQGYTVGSVPVADEQANREQAVSDLLRMWSPGPGGSTEQLEIALRKADTGQLAAAYKAKSYDEVNRILLGPSTNALGSTTGDYVFTAVPPCRIFDTRNVGGEIAAGGTRDFFVYGGAELATLQGGNAAGCPSPRGEPRAVHINLTVVPVAGPGNVRVYPQNVATPLTSVVNFQLGTNIANAFDVQTYYAPGPKEIQVYASNTAHVLADVMGYYYDADLTLGSGKTLTGDYSASVTNALANEFFMGSFSFPLRLASAPSGPNVNFIPSGSASTTNCPGTHANPTALPGNLCVYESAFNNRTFEGLFGTGVAVYASIDRFGGAIGLHATAAGRAHSYGTWAVTAP